MKNGLNGINGRQDATCLVKSWGGDDDDDDEEDEEESGVSNLWPLGP